MMLYTAAQQAVQLTSQQSLLCHKTWSTCKHCRGVTHSVRHRTQQTGKPPERRTDSPAGLVLIMPRTAALSCGCSLRCCVSAGATWKSTAARGMSSLQGTGKNAMQVETTTSQSLSARTEASLPGAAQHTLTAATKHAWRGGPLDVEVAHAVRERGSISCTDANLAKRKATAADQHKCGHVLVACFTLATLLVVIAPTWSRLPPP